MAQHIGIVGGLAEGAALLVPHVHPEISMHTPSLHHCVDCLARAALRRAA